MTTHLCEAVSKGEEFSTVEIKANDRKLPALSYAAQYCQLYYCRFKSFLPRLKAAAKTKWTIQSSNSCTFCERILDLEDQEESVIMGIVYVDSPAKPNVLADLEGEVRRINYAKANRSIIASSICLPPSNRPRIFAKKTQYIWRMIREG